MRACFTKTFSSLGSGKENGPAGPASFARNRHRRTAGAEAAEATPASGQDGTAPARSGGAIRRKMTSPLSTSPVRLPRSGPGQGAEGPSPLLRSQSEGDRELRRALLEQFAQGAEAPVSYYDLMDEVCAALAQNPDGAVQWAGKVPDDGAAGEGAVGADEDEVDSVGSYVPPGYPGHEEWTERERDREQEALAQLEGDNAEGSDEGEPYDAAVGDDLGQDGGDAATAAVWGAGQPQSSRAAAPGALRAGPGGADELSEEEPDEEDEWRSDMDPGFVAVPISAADFEDLVRELSDSEGDREGDRDASWEAAAVDDLLEADLREAERALGESPAKDRPPAPPPAPAPPSGPPAASLGCFSLKIIHDPRRTGFEETKEWLPKAGSLVAGRFLVEDVLGSAAFSTTLRCEDLGVKGSGSAASAAVWQQHGGYAPRERHARVCLKMIKNSKDYFDQSLDEIKILQHINSRGDPDRHRVVAFLDSFYYREHLFLVTELLRENLYEFNRFLREADAPPYFTLPRLCRVARQVLGALSFLHSLGIVHSDIKPENILIESFSRCLVKVVDFGSACFTTDRHTTYIQSRSYRAPEVVLGHRYDGRIDIWSLGAVLAELLTGYVLFQNDSVAAMLARIASICGSRGRFPDAFLETAPERQAFFTPQDIIYERAGEDAAEPVMLLYPKKTSLHHRLKLPPADRMSAQEASFLDCMSGLLRIDPEERLDADAALQQAWIVDGIAQEERGLDLSYQVQH